MIDPEQVLVTDHLITVLGPKGKYAFDWVDHEQNRIKFDPENSDFNEYTDEVREALDRSGLIIQSTESETTSDSPSLENPTESTAESPQHKESEETSTEYKPANTADTYSFVVQMRNPDERREIIEQIREDHMEASDDLELSGPYKVTYKVTPDGLELDSVEDLGLGLSLS